MSEISPSEKFKKDVTANALEKNKFDLEVKKIEKRLLLEEIENMQSRLDHAHSAAEKEATENIIRIFENNLDASEISANQIQRDLEETKNAFKN